MEWETVIGLEVHIELATESKIFCSCSTAFGAKPNEHCCPVCMGFPGTLPVFNKRVLEYALKAAIALNCDIPEYTVFDRKNYFYPDLPKAYQISQLYSPIGTNGHVDIDVDGTVKTIRIHEMHMEEDAGKLIHSDIDNVTYPDYNRCGVPLIEIVSEPDFRSAKEVVAYLEKLKMFCEYMGISSCKMQEGRMRADVNVSVRRAGDSAFGTRTETKNLNSFRAIEHAIEYESERQIEILEKGGVVHQETRRWDDEKRVGSSMRSKENAQDYRYFPDPDLLPIKIDRAQIEELRRGMPEFAEEKKARFIAEYGLSDYTSSRVTADIKLATLFEDAAKGCGAPRTVANWLIEIMPKVLDDCGVAFEDAQIDAVQFAKLLASVEGKKLNKNMGIKALEQLVRQGAEFDFDRYLKDNAVTMEGDEDKIRQVARKVLADNPKAVAEYGQGKTKVMGFLVGQVMRAFFGKVDHDAVNRVMLEELQTGGQR